MSRMFGTDGVRGVANEELTPLLAMQLGQAGAYVLTRENKHKPTIMVGCDTRMSGDMLANALMAGICSVGANAVYVGVIPTPAIAYLTKKYKVEAGVVISASHNPMEFNGIKFFDGNGYKLPDALEDEIEALIKNNMNRVEFPTGSSVGRIKYRKDAREEYINHAVRAVPVDLTNLKVVVDCAEGASHYTSIEALRQLGAQVVPIHNMPDGTNINANCGSTHMEELQARVVYEKANIGLAFDGDADRCLACDEKGAEIDGDKIMAVCGAYMKRNGRLTGNTIVATVMSNLGLHEFCRKNGIDLVCTNVGDRNVLEKMNECGYKLGGEQSGHMIFTDYATTGDGQLSALQFLQILALSGKSASVLTADCPQYPQVLLNVVVSHDRGVKEAIMASDALKTAVADEEKFLRGEGRILVRPSGTEALIRVMVEAKTESVAQLVAERLVKVIRSV
mgnify:CR=1 FL=1